jgi:hypothetical protein
MLLLCEAKYLVRRCSGKWVVPRFGLRDNPRSKAMIAPINAVPFWQQARSSK